MGEVALLSASQVLGNAEVCLAGGAKPLEISALLLHPSKAQPALPWCTPSRCELVWASGPAAGDVQGIEGPRRPGETQKHCHVNALKRWRLQTAMAASEKSEMVDEAS